MPQRRCLSAATLTTTRHFIIGNEATRDPPMRRIVCVPSPDTRMARVGRMVLTTKTW
jgi:hypothetical protein